MSSTRRSLFSVQPFKFIYMALFFTTLPFHILGIYVYFWPAFTRSPRTFKQAVANSFIRIWFKFATAVEYRTAKSLEPGKHEAQFLLMDPAQIDGVDYSGVLASNPAIKPGPIAGFCASATISTVQFPERVVLSAALQDAVTAYTYLLKTLNVRPENIVISGDSAGGNLVMALLRYIEDSKSALPLPRAALLWAPWVNPDAPREYADNHRNLRTDFIFGSLAEWVMRSYTPVGWSSSHPYISPLGNEFKTKVPIFIQTGTSELLYDSHVEFAKNIEQIGCKVKIVEIANAPHDVFVGGKGMSFPEETEDAIEQAAVFVKEAR